MDRPLLILDLDETLVYATKKSADVGHDFRVLDYYVRKRPHLDEFLERIFDWFEVAVWTSAGGIYAAEVVSCNTITHPSNAMDVSGILAEAARTLLHVKRESESHT